MSSIVNNVKNIIFSRIDDNNFIMLNPKVRQGEIICYFDLATIHQNVGVCNYYMIVKRSHDSRDKNLLYFGPAGMPTTIPARLC